MGPALISSFRLVPRPVENISSTTPISAKIEMVSLICTRFSRQGPMIRPAMISPTTCGALNLRATSPKNLALRMMMARFRKTEYINLPSSILFHLIGLSAAPDPLFFYYIAAQNQNQNTSQSFSLKKQTKFTKVSVQIFVRIFGPQGLTKQQGLAIINCCLNRHAAHVRRCRMSCVPLAS